MKISKRYLAIIGILLFVFILSKVNLEQVFLILSNIDLHLFLLGFFLLLLSICFKGVKWKIILSCQNQKISIFEAVKIFFIGLFLSMITPGRIGDFSRAVYANKNNIDLPIGIASVILDRLIDIGILLLLSFVAIIGFMSFFNAVIIPVEIIISILALFCLGLILLFKEKYLKILVRPFFNIIVPEKMKKKFSFGSVKFFDSLKIVKNKPILFLSAIFLGVLNWIVQIIIFYLFAMALSINVPLEFMFLIAPILSLLDLVPISVSGLGTRDAAVIFFFSFLSINSELAIAFSLLVFFTGYLLISLIGLILFILNPLNLQK